MYLATGAFVRGNFIDGFLTGTSYLRVNCEFSFLMRLDYGVLDNKTTIFDLSTDSLRVINYDEGKYTDTVKSFERSADKCHKEICLSVFGKEPGASKGMAELTNKCRNSKQSTFIGSFALSEKTWFYGVFSQGAPNGLGVMIELGGKIQMGYFENGQLAGLGRIIWPNGVVMDGMINKTQISEDVIVYNAVAHEWVEAEFKDNILMKETKKGMGYPKQSRRTLFNKFFNREYEKKFRVDISPDIFNPESKQELVFKLVYGDKWTDAHENNFKFRFSGEKKIEVDSNKFESEPGDNKMISGGGQNSSQGKPDSIDNFKFNANPSNESQRDRFAENASRQKGGKQELNQLRGDYHGSEDANSQNLAGGKIGGKKPTDKIEAFTLGDENFNLIYEESPQGKGGNRGGSDDQFSGNLSPQKGANGGFSQPASANKTPGAVKGSQFDRYEMMILQRSVNWDEGDKSMSQSGTLGQGKKGKKSALQARKGMSEESKVNIIKNYVEDFMEAFMDKKTIDSLLGNIEGYSLIKKIK
jgi:hypothetical protein